MQFDVTHTATPYGHVEENARKNTQLHNLTVIAFISFCQELLSQQRLDLGDIKSNLDTLQVSNPYPTNTAFRNY